MNCGGDPLEEKRFAVIGTDGRQRAAAAYLARLGYPVAGEEGLVSADVVLLPTPLAAAKLSLPQLLAQLRPGTMVFAGAVKEREQAIAAAAGVQLFDCLAREELAILNAIPTCEGAIEILLHERDQTLWNSRVLILGFGRIAKLLAQRLAGFGALVTAAARRPDARALALALGYRALEIDRLRQTASEYEILVNTVPAPLIDRETAGFLRQDAFVLDLTSAPGGVDLDAAQQRGIRALRAGGLPAKCAPKTAGRFLAQTVLKMMEEMDR